MNINIFLFLLIIIIVFTAEFCLNIDHIIHYFYNRKYSDIPTLPYMIKKIYKFLESITENKLKGYTFVDIGCGDGNLLSKLCKNNMFNKKFPENITTISDAINEAGGITSSTDLSVIMVNV